MAIDQRRIEARRDGLLPCCLTHKNWTPSSCSQKEIGKMGMQILADCLAYMTYKVIHFSRNSNIKVFQSNILTRVQAWSKSMHVLKFLSLYFS